MTTLFDNTVIPEWAKGCISCVPDAFNRYSEEAHLEQHQPITCGVCGETSSTRWHAELNHAISLGASRRLNALLCTSLSLRLAHLAYDKREGHTPHPHDLRALDLGWVISDTGQPIPPEGWPDASQAARSFLMEAVA